MIKAIRRQTIIFLAYFLFSSLFLLNRNGGADIAFLFLMYSCLFLHLIVMFRKLYLGRKDTSAKAWNRTDFITYCLCLFIFTLTHFSYLDYINSMFGKHNTKDKTEVIGL